MKFIVSEFLSYENNKDNNSNINFQSNICFIYSLLFIETYDINQITNCTWKQLCVRLREEIAHQNSNDFILFANRRGFILEIRSFLITANLRKDKK